MKKKIEFWLLILLVISPAALAVVTLQHGTKVTVAASETRHTVVGKSRLDEEPCVPAASLGIPCTFIEAETMSITVPAPPSPLTATL